MEIQFIDLAAQYRALKPEIDARMARVLEHGRYIMGPEVREMEQALVARTGAPHCISVASGTEALLISLMAIGVKAGDEVITTAFTFVATAEVIALLGAVPVFVDVEPDTCNIDAGLIEAAITPRTRAIIPVSLYGQVADMEAINEIAARHPQITVIEDAAQSFGSTRNGRQSCNLSKIACTSFFPSKPLGCYGDGGAIFTDDDALAKAMSEIRVHGQERRYYHTRVGVGGRMDTLQCAVVLAKLGRFDLECELRQQVAGRYLDALKDLPGLELPVLRAGNVSAWGQFTVQLDDRAMVVKHLDAANIPTAVHYPVPLHQQPAYRDNCRIASTLEQSERVAGRVMSLPMSPDLSAVQQDYIISHLRSALVA